MKLLSTDSDARRSAGDWANSHRWGDCIRSACRQWSATRLAWFDHTFDSPEWVPHGRLHWTQESERADRGTDSGLIAPS